MSDIGIYRQSFGWLSNHDQDRVAGTDSRVIKADCRLR